MKKFHYPLYFASRFCRLCLFFNRHLLGFISVGEVIAKILRIVNYYLFIYYLIAFIMITVLKKTREKTHLNKTQKRGTKVRDTQQSEASN